MKVKNQLLVTAAFAWLGIAASVQGQVPPLINYQGQLTDAGGTPSNGTFTMVFSIFNVPTGGTALYTETQSVTVTNGIFNVLIGSVTPIPLNLFDASPDAYLQVTVSGTVLTPRRRFGSVPYAFTSRATGGTGVQQVNGGTGITVTNPTGPITTVSVTANSINDALVQDNSLTDLSLASNSVGNSEIADNAVTATKISPNIISSLDGVSNDGGDIDLIAGTNVTITPNDAGNSITISASGTGGGISTLVGGNSITITNPTGPTATVAVTPNSIDDADVVDNSLTSLSLAAGSVGTSELQPNIDLTPAGSLEVGNASGLLRSLVTYNAAGGGFISIDAANGTDVIRMTTGGGGTFGYFNVNADDGSEAVTITTFNTGAGQAGDVLVKNAAGVTRADLTVLSVGSGGLFTYATDGSDAVNVTTTGGGAAGFISVHDANGTSTISINGTNGEIRARAFTVVSALNFIVDHPLDPGKEIHYASLEGPEAGVYVRGTARLVDGQARIQLPDHFPLVAVDQGLTVQLTPLSASSEGLAVVSKSTREIVARELRNGAGTYDFDYVIHAVRKGFEDFQVVRNKAAAAADAAVPTAPQQGDPAPVKAQPAPKPPEGNQ